MLSLIRKYTRRFYENNRNLVLLLTSLSALGVFYAPIYLKYKKDSKDPIKLEKKKIFDQETEIRKARTKEITDRLKVSKDPEEIKELKAKLQIENQIRRKIMRELGGF